MRFLIIPFLFTALTSSVFADQEYSYPSPPPSIAASPPPSDAPLKPSIAVAIAILTTTFFVIFLILLYLKHCKQGNSNSAGYYAEHFNDYRKNSGVNRMVIESLPVFRFKSLRGHHKDGMECAVCLNKFEASELLRLLPKCKHAFHAECVDTWLDAHSTCPLCRYRVHPEDILLLGNNVFSQRVSTTQEKHEDDVVLNVNPRRVPGRHSYAGEARGIVNEVSKTSILQNRHSADTMTISTTNCSNAKASRKDGLLLSRNTRNLDHRINIVWDESEMPGPAYAQERCKAEVSGLAFVQEEVSGTAYGEERCKSEVSEATYAQERWSDVHISDLMYGRAPQMLRHKHENEGMCSSSWVHYNNYYNNYINGDGRNVINERSASEMTGVSRFSSSGINRYGQGLEGREEGVLSRWLSWINPNTTSAVAVAGSAPSCSALSHS